MAPRQHRGHRQKEVSPPRGEPPERAPLPDPPEEVADRREPDPVMAPQNTTKLEMQSTGAGNKTVAEPPTARPTRRNPAAEPHRGSTERGKSSLVAPSNWGGQEKEVLPKQRQAPPEGDEVSKMQALRGVPLTAVLLGGSAAFEDAFYDGEEPRWFLMLLDDGYELQRSGLDMSEVSNAIEQAIMAKNDPAMNVTQESGLRGSAADGSVSPKQGDPSDGARTHPTTSRSSPERRPST